MGKDIKIRKLKICDFEEACALWIEAGLSVADKQREKAEFVKLLELNPDICLCVVLNKNIIGTVMGAFNGKRAWIYHLAIDPSKQGNGIGTQLIKTVEEKLEKKDTTKIYLGISIKNLKVFPFYEKLGYEVKSDMVMCAKDLWKE